MINYIIVIFIIVSIFISFPIGVLADSIDRFRIIYMKAHNIPIKKSKLTLLLEKNNIIKNNKDNINNNNNNNNKDNSNKSAE